MVEDVRRGRSTRRRVGSMGSNGRQWIKGHSLGENKDVWTRMKEKKKGV